MRRLGCDATVRAAINCICASILCSLIAMLLLVEALGALA